MVLICFFDTKQSFAPCLVSKETGRNATILERGAPKKKAPIWVLFYNQDLEPPKMDQAVYLKCWLLLKAGVSLGPRTCGCLVGPRQATIGNPNRHCPFSVERVS